MTKRSKTSPRTSPSAADSGSPSPDFVRPIKRGRGRPGHVPTKETRAAVESLSGMGHCQEDICDALGLGSTNTLAKYYGLELRMGRIKANDNVAKSLYKQAIDGNTTAGIWWEKTRAGKSDRHEITGKDGGPIATAPLLILYANRSASPTVAATDAIFRMTPLICLVICDTAAIMQL